MQCQHRQEEEGHSPLTQISQVPYISEGALGLSVPVEVLLRRLEHEVKRGTFYIMTRDRASDVEAAATRLQLRGDAAVSCLPPGRQLPVPDQPWEASVQIDLRAA